MDEYTLFLTKHPRLKFIDSQFNGNKSQQTLYLLEAHNISPQHYEDDVLKQYKKILTWNKKFYDLKKKMFNMKYIPNGITCFNRDYFGYIDNFIPYEKKINGVVLIAKNRDGKTNDFDISPYRRVILDEIEKTGKIETFVFGNGFENHHKYRGIIGESGKESSMPSSKEKLTELSKYKFCLCFENCYHEFWSWDYITEKILDCFRAKTIPIYYGCYNIEQHIPKELFIDFRDFKNDVGSLVNFLLSINKERYEEIANSALEWERQTLVGSVNNLKEAILEK